MLTDVACRDVCAELRADGCTAAAPLPHARIASAVDITNSALHTQLLQIHIAAHGSNLAPCMWVSHVHRGMSSITAHACAVMAHADPQHEHV